MTSDKKQVIESRRTGGKKGENPDDQSTSIKGTSRNALYPDLTSQLAIPTPASRSMSCSSHEFSSNPGFTCRLSSVATACGCSHENPAGRHSTWVRFRRQFPWENGLGGAGPSPSDLCAWLRICSIVVTFKRRSYRCSREQQHRQKRNYDKGRYAL